MFATGVHLALFAIKYHLDALGLGTENQFSTSKIFYKSNSTVKTTYSTGKKAS